MPKTYSPESPTRTAEFIVSIGLILLALSVGAWIVHGQGWHALMDSRGVLHLVFLAVAYPLMLYLLKRSKAPKPLLEMWAFAPVTLLGYRALGLIMRDFAFTSKESLFYSMDLALGFDVYDLSAGSLAAGITELFGLGYLFYYPYCISRAYSISKKLDQPAERFLLGIAIAYMLGFAGYFLFPALGPRYTAAGAFAPAGPISQLAILLVDHAGSPWAVMPSMHVGATFFILFFDAIYNRKWFFINLAPVLLLGTATVGLGFHYLVDVFAGLSIAVFSLLLAHSLPLWLSGKAVLAEELRPIFLALKRLV